MKNIAESVEFYQDNKIDEIIVEESQNLFLKKPETTKSLNAKNKLPEIKEEFIAKKRDLVMQKHSQNNILREKPLQKKEDFYRSLTKQSGKKNEENGVKLVKSTFDAISSLAKRSKNQENINPLNSRDKFMSIDEIVKSAEDLAKKCTTTEELKKAVENFDGCNLKKMATNTVFCDGNADSKVMIIGEAPGNHEDLQGVPFCGDSGKLLDNMFLAIDMKRENDYYITNVIFWRPPGNRRPTEEEIKICWPFVKRHIQLVDPKIIILVGATSMSAVLNKKDPISKVRGQIIKHKFDFMEKELNNFVIFHPSYLMRQSAKKRIAWRDMLNLKEIINS